MHSPPLTMLSTVCSSVVLLLVLPECPLGAPSEAGGGSRRMDPLLIEEYCKNFTIGNPNAKEFYSPLYPGAYPQDITCFRTITADIGYFVRIDFRDMFIIEPPSTAGDCEYDYLEIRDGDQGYSPLIGKYCGSNFPPIITSSGRSLWLRFSSDNTIQYMGFKAVYQFIENPLDHLPDIGKCAFETGGYEDFIGTANISVDRIDHSKAYDTPIDCVWTIRVPKEFMVYLQFPDYELDQPNDCHLNYIQVFDGKTDEEHRLKNFCGSVAESVTSKTNEVFVRFYAEKSGINSQFRAVFTAMRILEGPNDACDEETEYDCDDATCIHPDLVCNEVRNCKFGWDEESCVDAASNITLDFSSAHVIVIIIVLIIILLGMGFGMIWNLIRSLNEDKEELASREKSLDNLSSPPNLTESEMPTVIPPAPLPPRSGHKKSDHSRHAAGSAAGDSNGGCYVPAGDGGFPFNSRLETWPTKEMLRRKQVTCRCPCGVVKTNAGRPLQSRAVVSAPSGRPPAPRAAASSAYQSCNGGQFLVLKPAAGSAAEPYTRCPKLRHQLQLGRQRSEEEPSCCSASGSSTNNTSFNNASSVLAMVTPGHPIGIGGAQPGAYGGNRIAMLRFRSNSSSKEDADEDDSQIDEIFYITDR